MEQFFRTHPGTRWLIIGLLLMGILAEIVLSSWALTAGASQRATLPPTVATPEPSGPQLSCTVLTQLNLRSGPSVEYDPPLTQLATDTRVTAIARNGEVPWLRVQVGGTEGRLGWVSSRSNEGALVECDGDINQLPEQGPDVAAAEQAEEEEPAAPAAPTITLDTGLLLRQNNGPTLRAPRRTFAIALDGNLGEWASSEGVPIENVVYRPENWSGPADLSGTVRAAWDDGFLYLAAQVTDDVIVQENREDLLIRGDALEFFWDSDLQGDFEVNQYNEDEIQGVMSPGNFAGNAPSAWVYGANNFRDEISVATSRTPQGYDLEIRIPWARLSVLPRVGNVYGYAIALSDDDSPGSGEQETQVSVTVNRPYPQPLNWTNFVLEP